MNELERAATALLDRPAPPPAPLESIERRAGALRRRRRLLEVGAAALVVLLLGTAGLALNANRGGDGPDQGVFVGEGPPAPGDATVSTYRLVSPVDAATATALQLTIERRLFSAGMPGADVVVDGTEVTVTTSVPSDDVAFLVTSPGGYELRPVQGESPASLCESGAGDDALWTSKSVGPPRCLGLLPAVALPDEPTTAAGVSDVPTGGYQIDLVLTPEASQALADHPRACTSLEPSPCRLQPLAVVASDVVLDPDATLVIFRDPGGIAQIAVGDFVDRDEALRWSAVLAAPLPDGVNLVEESAPGPTTADSVAEPNPSNAPNTRIVCVEGGIDAASSAGSAAEIGGALQARFAAIGRTVEVAVVTQATIEPFVPCGSVEALTLSSGYETSDPDWAIDQAALLAPGILRSRVDGAVLHPVSAASRAGDASTDGRPSVVVELPPDEFDAISQSAATVNCIGPWACWLGFDIDGAIPTNDLARDAPPNSIVLVLAPGDEARAARLAALLSHPLPDGVTFP